MLDNNPPAPTLGKGLNRGKGLLNVNVVDVDTDRSANTLDKKVSARTKAAEDYLAQKKKAPSDRKYQHYNSIEEVDAELASLLNKICVYMDLNQVRTVDKLLVDLEKYSVNVVNEPNTYGWEFEKFIEVFETKLHFSPAESQKLAE